MLNWHLSLLRATPSEADTRCGKDRACDTGGGFYLADGEGLVLDRFIPNPEVAEHHEITIQAPVHIVMAAAKSLELMTSPAC